MEGTPDSSFSEQWSASSASHTKEDLQTIHELSMKNLHLQEIVNQLQSSLDSSNSQLQQALATAESFKGLQNDITNLQNQLKTSKDEALAAKKELSTQTAKFKEIIDETNSQYESEHRKLMKNTETLQNDIVKYKKSLSHITKERDAYKNELMRVESERDIITEAMEKQKKLKDKQRAKNVLLTQKIGELLEDAKQLAAQHESDLATIREKSNKIEEAQANVEALSTEHTKLETLYNQKRLDYDNLEKSLEVLEEQYTIMKEENTYLVEERNKYVSIISRTHSALCSSEDTINNLKQQNNILIAKAKKANQSQPSMFSDRIDINTFSFPFGDEVKSKINEILGMDQFQSAQKIQIIINEIARIINGFEKVREEHENTLKQRQEELESTKSAYEKTYGILKSILRDWKNLEFNEKRLDLTAFCDSDQDFLDLLARECVTVESTPDASQYLEPGFSMPDYFNEAHAEDRRQVLEKAAEVDSNLYNIVSAMFLLNTRLKKQLDKFAQSCAHRDEVEKLLADVGVDNFDVIPGVIGELQDEIKHLKKTRKEVHTALVTAHRAITEREAAACNLKAQVATLRSKISDLENENAGLMSAAAKATSEAAEKDEKIAELTDEKEQLQTSLSNTQAALQQKQAECRRQLEEAEELCEQAQRESQKRSRKAASNEQALNSQVADMQILLQAAEERIAKTQKKSKNTIKELTKNHEERIAAITSECDAVKARLNEVLAETKAKGEKVTQHVNELQEQLTQVQEKNGELQRDNEKLCTAVRSLEQKASAMADMYKKEQKNTVTANTAKILSLEAKHQKELKELRTKCEAEQQRVSDFLTNNVAAIYGLSGLEYDEGQLMQIFGRIRSDLAKLQFFQEQATKF